MLFISGVFCHLVILKNLSERFQNSGQYVFHLRDADTVIGDGNSGSFTGIDPRQNFPPSEHAAAALDDKPVGLSLIHI